LIHFYKRNMDQVKSEIIECPSCPNNDSSQLFQDISILKAVVVSLKQWLRDIHQQLEEEEENPAKILQKMKLWLKNIPADLREEGDSGPSVEEEAVPGNMEEKTVLGTMEEEYEPNTMEEEYVPNTMEDEYVPEMSDYVHQGGYKHTPEDPGQQFELKQEVEDFEYVCAPIVQEEHNPPDSVTDPVYDHLALSSCLKNELPVEEVCRRRTMSRHFADKYSLHRRQKPKTKCKNELPVEEVRRRKTKSRQYKCVTCGRHFSSKRNLIRHEKQKN